jgi:hypothetical protein
MYDSEFTEHSRTITAMIQSLQRTLTAMYDSEFTENTRGQSQPCMIQSLQRTLEDNHSHE